MSKKKLWAFIFTLAVAVPMIYAPAADAHTTISNWNSSNHGFFKHNSESGGWWNVWPSSGGRSGCKGNGNALPTSVNTPKEFIDFVKCKLGGNTQEKIGAAFIISTMIGVRDSTPSSSHIKEFEARINYAADRGWINFNATLSCSTGSPPRNTFYQSTRHDVAWYRGCPVNNSGNVMTSYKAITIKGGSSTYIIARLCANPIGDMRPLANPDYNMNGRSTVNDTTAMPGQTLTFRHYLRNSGSTTTGREIDWKIRNTISGGITLTGSSGPFSAGQEQLVRSHTVGVPDDARPGTQICRRIEWNPDNPNGGSGQSTPACSVVQANFDLEPSINVRINGGSSSTNFIEPGDEVEFIYSVNNSRNGYAYDTNCEIYGNSKTGYHPIPNPIDDSSSPGFSEPSHGCPRNLPGNSNTTLVTETVPGSDIVANRSICRSLFVDPATPDGGAAGTEACVYVTSKPYYRIYGGDLSAGGGFSAELGGCAVNNEAAIIGWNKRSSGGWAGAGAQFAEYAMNTIFDSSSSLGNAGGSAPRPTGLTFANTGVGGNSSNGHFGGHLGSVSCIPDYYSGRPDSTSPISSGFNLSPLGSGAYSASGNIRTTGGSVDPGEEVDIYIDGNLYIDGNITYGGEGSWNSASIPTLRVIVRGNIFIDSDVTRLDGLFVAQPGSGADGIIATCAVNNQFTSLSPESAQFHSDCENKLVVNGSLAARQLRLMRTSGTLKSSSTGENAGGSMAEAFNYSPALWIAQPFGNGGAGSGYDAITTLPPVL